MERILGDCRLLRGDCLELLQDIGQVNHLISDPPYESASQDKIGGIRRNDGGRVTDKLNFVPIDEIRAPFMQAIKPLCSGWGIVFCTTEGVALWRDEIEGAGIKYKSAYVWIKPDAMPKFNGQGPSVAHENIVTMWFGSGHSSWNGGGRRGIFTHCTNQPDREGTHPTEKPLPLMMELVSLFTQPGDIILDPFMGSGTTGIACVKLGRKFIGIEKDESYYDLACRRIENVYKQPDFFVPYAATKDAQMKLDIGVK